MDRARRLIALAAVMAHQVACGGADGARGRSLRAGEAPPSAPSGLRVRTRAASGVLSYGVAIDSVRSRLVSVELGVAFELVVRNLDDRGKVTSIARTELGPPDWDISGPALAADGRTAWIASTDGTVRAIDVDAGRATVTWRVGDAATAVAVSRDGRYVATGTRSGVVCLRRVADGALLHCLIAHAKAVSAIDFSIDRLATASWAGDVAVWELPSLASAGRKQIPGSANDVAFSPDGSALAVATSGAPPVRTPAIERRERRDGYRSPDPSALIQVWGQRGDDVVCRGHAGAVTAVVWTPDGRGLLSGSWDRSVRLWDPRSGRERDRIAGLRHIVRDVAAGGGGRWAAAAAWALGDGEPSSLLLDLLYTAD